MTASQGDDMFTRRSFMKAFAGTAAALLPAARHAEAASSRDFGETRLLMGTFVSIRTAGAPA